MTRFGLYGSGWRAEFFIRVARSLPHLFSIAGMITRDPEKAARFIRLGLHVYPAAEELLATGHIDFMVVSVNASVSVDISLDLLRQGVPVLLETPVAPSIPDLARFKQSLPAGAKLQIAEQYPLQPMHQARLAMIAQGKLGTPSFVQISNTHAFHAIALMRKYLGIGLTETVTKVTATSFPISGVAGFMRDGLSPTERIDTPTQVIATMQFDNGKVGLINHEGGQHRSYVRSSIVQVKGERGEILNSQLKYLKDHRTPITSTFEHKLLGQEDNFEGYDLKGIFVDSQWIYTNPYTGSRLVDDEIAVAQLMKHMAEYVAGGACYYGIEEAGRDVALWAEVEAALQS